jgi:hypothetical protein
VTVRVLKAVPIHKSMVLRVAISASTGVDGFPNQIIDVRPAFAGQGDENFCALGRITDLLWREDPELFMGE